MENLIGLLIFRSFIAIDISASAHTCCKSLLRAFSVVITVHILIANALDKRLQNSYNTTIPMS